MSILKRKGNGKMTLDEFKAIYTENPSADSVMEEISRLYASETQLTASFAEADAEREKLRKELDDANKRYRERFFSGGSNPPPDNTTDPFSAFFKEKE